MKTKDFIMPANTVWVNTNNNDIRTGYIGRIDEVKNSSLVDVYNLETKEINTENISNIFEVCPAPINGKNIVSDWIEEDL